MGFKRKKVKFKRKSKLKRVVYLKILYPGILIAKCALSKIQTKTVLFEETQKNTF